MAKQLGFYVEQDRCIKCYSCQVGCKAWYGIEPGLNLIKIYDVWEGKFPDVKRTFSPTACWHCAAPPCVEFCSSGALSKRAADGVVVVDSNLCQGCKKCLEVCPWGIPQFGKNSIAQICNLCLDRLEKGQKPICVAACPLEALHVGTMEELMALGEKKKAKRLEGASGPSVLIA